LRRHPVTFIPKILLFLTLLAVPAIVYWMISSLYPDLFFNAIVYPVAIIVGASYYLGAYLLFYTQYINHYLDIWVVTNDRIVDVEQLGLFSRTISELDLFRIQDVTTDVHGFFATIFHYGDVSVKTASANINIVFRQVCSPNKIREDLIRMADEDSKHHSHDA